MESYSAIAEFALGLWVPLSIGLFFFFRPQRAALIAILGGDLFLPELANFKYPLLPPLDKHNLPYLCVLVGCLLRRPSRVTRLPKERWFVFLTLVIIVGASLTGLTNGDPVIRKWLPPLPGLNLKDGLYMAAANLGQVALPFYLGCVLFRSAKDFRELLVGFAVAGVIYVPFTLFEARMSPQLHSWIYGYMQHGFGQTQRWGGYRPMVFMSHGLSLARFFMVATFAAFILGRAKRTLFGVSANLIGCVLLTVLVLCKSTGAIIFTVVGVPLLVWGKAKTQMRIAVILGSFVFLYPLLRSWQLIPTDWILQTSHSLVGADRTESLQYRFVNENALLERARQRLAFGWGEYSRNLVFGPWGDVSVPDGYWVIQIGIIGMVGFVASFGPMLIPLFLMRYRVKLVPAEADRRVVGGVAVMLGLVALDWIPNGLWAPYPYLIAGAFAGLTRDLTLKRSDPIEIGDRPEDSPYNDPPLPEASFSRRR